MDQAEIAQDGVGLQEVLQVQLIVSMRIYDVLMALLTTQDDEIAIKLREVHKSGRILFDEPSFSGEFLASDDASGLAN